MNFPLKSTHTQQFQCPINKCWQMGLVG